MIVICLLFWASEEAHSLAMIWSISKLAPGAFDLENSFRLSKTCNINDSEPYDPVQ